MKTRTGILFFSGVMLISWVSYTNQSKKSIDPANFDVAVKPTDNFYAYVNGTWIKKNPVPSTESAWGSFSEIRESNTAHLKAILEETVKSNAAPGSNKQKIGDYYHTVMDTTSIEQMGIKPISHLFDKIKNLKSISEIPALLSYHHTIGVNPLFHFGISADKKNSEKNMIYVYQGGLNLPDRDYYLKDDPKSETIRKEYILHVQKMFELLGDNPTVAEANAKVVLNIETDLASNSRTRVQRRDTEANYNKKTYEELKALTSSFNWDDYFKGVKINNVKEVIVGQPEFLTALENILLKYKLEDWKNYLRWNLIHEMAPRLSSAFVTENFHFYSFVLSGQKEMRPRWKRALSAVDASLGEALGQLYVEKHFPAESKKRVNEMIDNLIAAYRERINSRPWMSEETKTQALAKLNAIKRKIGYPDQWRDYSALEIKRDSYVLNYIRANEFESNYSISQLDKPVDKTRWGLSPPTVNAYYNPLYNEIAFPAGIMQPPFFNPNADDAINYGSMGAVIGHELTHGFDDAGSRFDAEGNLKDWWNEADKKNFKEKTSAMVKQFDGYTVLDSMNLNGSLTLGENIADLGGLTLAYYAFKKSLEGKPQPEKIEGFTAEQRFFMAWAQGWRNNMRPESLRNMVMTNPHSPSEFRVNGPLSNMKEFYEAFGVKPGDKMYKTDSERIEIW